MKKVLVISGVAVVLIGGYFIYKELKKESGKITDPTQAKIPVKISPEINRVLTKRNN